MKKTRIVPLSDEGQRLFKFLQRAAGLQDFSIKTLEVRLDCKEAITFTAVCHVFKEDIAAAFDDLQLAEGPSDEEIIDTLKAMVK